MSISTRRDSSGGQFARGSTQVGGTLPSGAGFGAAAVPYVAGWLALTSQWLMGRLTIPYDAKAHFYAQIQFLAHALHSGQSPFWTSNVFGGSPQIADPQSLIFSPALLLAYFFKEPSFQLVDGYVFALLGCGALALIAFFRDRGWHPVGALVAAFGFSFGASAAWRIQHIGEIQSYALFPIVLWCLSRALVTNSRVWAIATGVSAGLMIVEPDQVALLSSYVLAAFALSEILRQARPLDALRQAVPSLATIGGSALIVSLVPLILAYMFVEGSNRPQIAFSEAIHGSLHPASLLTLMIGDLFGALDPGVDYWGPYSTSWDPTDITLSQNMSQLYVGAGPFLLILLVGIVGRQMWRSEIRFFTLALAVMMVYALGRYTPGFGIFYKLVPGVDLFRRPADATFLIGALLAVLAGYCAHRLVIDKRPGLSRRHLEIGGAVTAALFAVAMLIALAEGHARDVVKPMAIASLWLVASVLMLASLRPLAQSRVRVTLVAVAALMVGDLYANNGPNPSTALPTANYAFMRTDCKDETIGYLKAHLQRMPATARRDRVEMVGMGFSWPNIGMIHGFDHLLGYNPLRLDVASRAIGAGETIAGWDQRRFTPLFPSYRSLLADMLGLRYVVAPVPIEKVDTKLRAGDLRQVARTANAFIYENPRAFPRAMFVRDWQVASFEHLIETGAWPSFDPRRTLLLEAPPPVTSAHIAATSATEMPGAAVTDVSAEPKIMHFENTRIDIEVDAPTDGFLLFNSVWHPWWRATVDGESRDILKANVLFRAVQVTAGRHRVHFEFEPIAGVIAEIEHAGDRRTDLATVTHAARQPRT